MALASPSTDILLAFAPVPDAVRSASNAVRDAGPLSPAQKIVFHARLSEDHVRVEVADHGPGFDPEVRHDTSGFGLRLVDKLASRWGVERTARGRRVWFEG